MYTLLVLATGTAGVFLVTGLLVDRSGDRADCCDDCAIGAHAYCDGCDCDHDTVCPTCAGDGEIWHPRWGARTCPDPTVRCPDCAGTGHATTNHPEGSVR